MSETFEKPKGFKKKLENFWYHNKIAVLLVLFFVASAVYLGVDMLKKQDPDMVLTYVSRTYGDETQFRRIEPTLFSIVGDLNGDGKTKLNYRLLFVRERDITNFDVDVEQAFNYSFLDKNVRLYFIEDALFADKQAYFEPLEEILPEAYLSGGLKNAEGQVCAVPLSESAAAEEMHMNRPEMYVAVKRIMDIEKHDSLCMEQHEKAKEILKYIVEGDK